MAAASRQPANPITFDYFQRSRHLWHQFPIQPAQLGWEGSRPYLVGDQVPAERSSGRTYRDELYCPECFENGPRRIMFDYPAILSGQSGYLHIPDCRIVLHRLPLDDYLAKFHTSLKPSEPEPDVTPGVSPDDLLTLVVRLAPTCRCVGVSQDDDIAFTSTGEPRRITRSFAHLTAPRPGFPDLRDHFKVESCNDERVSTSPCSAWIYDMKILRDANLIVPDLK